MSYCHAALAMLLTTTKVAGPILVVLVLEWVVWPLALPFLPDSPRCPICNSSFLWNEIDTGSSRSRPLSFPCPKCLQPIGAPSWRKSFLLVLYLAVVAIFMFMLFELPGGLFFGYVGVVVAAVGAIRIADWFIRKKLEPGRSPETDSPSLFS
jgi:hypothetical protein